MNGPALNRRRLLGAVAAAPLVSFPTLAAAETAPAKWRCAADAYWRAVETTERYDREYHTPALSRFDAVRDRWPWHHDFRRDPVASAELQPALDAFKPYEERHSRHVWDQEGAAYELALLPAPDVTALAEKAAIIFREYDGCHWPEEVTRAVLTDARRHVAGAAAWPLAFVEETK